MEIKKDPIYEEPKKIFGKPPERTTQKSVPFTIPMVTV
jgi:hypothetical protein